jgi:hypothetical protein
MDQKLDQKLDQEQRIADLEAQIGNLSVPRRSNGRRTRWAAIGAAVAVSLGGGTGFYYAHAAPGDVVQTSFVPVEPQRILDTRPAPDNVSGFVGPLGAGDVHDFQVTGLAGVPANAASVVLNVTVTGTTQPSFLTLYPTGAVRPLASNLNWSAAGVTVPNLVTVKIGTGGKVSVYNLAGSAHVVADVAGYYAPGNDKFISVDVFGGGAGQGAVNTGGSGAGAGLQFGDAVNDDAYFHVVLPPDYTPGTTIVGTFTWHINAVSCAVTWLPNSTSVSRAGAIHPVGPSAWSGMSEPGVIAQGTTANLVNSTTFTLTSPNASFTLQPGDSYSFSLFRFGGAVTDTCAGTAKIDSIVLRYE